MSNKLNGIYKDIIKNKNLKENIPVFLDVMTDKYHTISAVKLALNYYTYYEMYCDEGNLWSNSLLEYFKKVNQIISEAVFSNSGNEAKDYLKDVDDLRNSLIAKMDLITSYTDFFRIYEYALNRVEYRFKDMEELDDDEEIAKNILRFIFDNKKDNVQINEMIKIIIGQLPVRITKQKYFEYIKEGFYQLLGSQEDTFETYIYLVRSSATLGVIDGSKDIYPDLWEKKEKLEKLNFREITKEEYETAIQLIHEAGKILDRECTAYYSLIEVVNELYALLLCANYVDAKVSDSVELKDAALFIIDGINRTYLINKQEELPQDIIRKFDILEGYQEDTEYDLIKLEDALYHVNEQHRALVGNLMKESLLDMLLNANDLLSDSIFIDLHRNKKIDTVDKESFQIKIDKLIKELSDKFNNCDRMIVRAIMANTIDKLPVFFNNHSEVKDYVLYSLTKCTDKAEKYASLEIINEIMNC